MPQADVIPDDGEAARADAVGLRIGRFAVLQVVGAGGMGKVYAAYDPQLDRKVAVKLVHRGAAGGSEGRARLLREAQALARVSSPHVVAIHDVGTHEGEVFMAMEFVTGVDLRRWLREAPRRWQDVLEKFLQAGEGLQAVHAAGLVHCDVKPGNVLVGVDGRVRLADFGLVGVTDQSAESTSASSDISLDDEPLSAPGAVMGTPGYMSPEQHRRRPLTAASDLFSFCVALYEGLYGERPYRARGLEALAAAKEAGAIAPPPPDRQVPAWLRAVVVRGLAVAPGDRWPSMAALLAALRDDPVVRRRRRLRFAGWLALAGLLGLTLVLLGLAGWAAWRRAQAEALAEQHLAAATRRIDALDGAGDRDAAAAALAAFVDAEEHRGTRALARAWLDEAGRARRRRDLAAARAAFGHAYSSATEPEGELAALRGLAEMLFESWSIDHLEVVLAALARLPGAADEPALARWRFEAAVAQRDLAGALAEPPDVHPDALPVVRALAAATQTEQRAGRVVQLDDKRIALASETAVTLTAATPSLPTETLVAVPDRLSSPPFILPGPRGEVWLVGWRELGGDRTEMVLYELRGAALHELLRWEDALPHCATVLDGPEGPTIYVGIGPFGRHLLALRPGPRAWTRGAPHPGTDALLSDISALALLDLDGDARDELAVAVGAWRAYDVRLFRPRPDGGLELAVRHKLGDVSALTGLRRPDGPTLLAAAKTDRWANPTFFPAAPHFGDPAGVYLWALEGAALKQVALLPLRDDAGGPAWSVKSLRAGDLDGDGRDDLVAQIGDPDDPLPSLVVDRALPGDRFARLRLRGALPRGLVQLDDDPQLELVAEIDERLWVLGAGEAAPPRLTAPQPAQVEVQAGSDPTLLETQRRAEDLVAMGLAREAAALLRRSADLAPDPAQQAALLRRAADLHAAAGATDDALRVLEQLARIDGVAGLWSAARLYLESGRAREALQRLDALLELDDLPPELRAEADALRGRLTPIARPSEVVTWRFDHPLDERWRISDPLGFRRDPLRGAVRLDLFADAGALATAPLDWDGAPLTIEVDLTGERLEWGSGLTIGLRPAGAAGPLVPLGVGVEAHGSRTDIVFRAQCLHPEHARPLRIVDMPVPDADAPLRGSLRLELHEARVVCSWTPLDGPPKRVVHPLRQPPAGGRYELVVAPVQRGNPERPWSTVLLHRVEVGHARAGEARLDPPARAALLHAEGELAAALTAYDALRRPTPLVHVWRAAAALALGRPRDAEAALDLALERPDPAAREALGHLLRLAPERYGPPLRERTPALYFELLVAHWALPLLMNPDATTLAPLDALLDARDAADPRAGRARLWLLTHRGMRWARLGERERARRDLAAALATAFEPPSAPDVQIEIGRLIVAAHRELALLALTEGKDDEARAHVRAALAHAPAPELVGDELWVRPEFERLRDDPDWRALLGR